MRTLTLPLLLAAAIGLNACTSHKQPSPVKHVIVIGIDGMSPDGILNADTPVLDSLMAHGSSTMRARTVLPTSSSSNWASMLMGAGPEQHGVTSNNWERDDHSLPPVVTGTEDIFPTIFGTLHQARPEAVIASVYHWSGFGRLYERSAVNVDINPQTEAATADTAVAVLNRYHPTLTFVHIDHVDGAGHGEGHGSPAYYAAVSRADSLIGVILDGARQAGMADDLVVIICSDHGGIGFGHGGETPEEANIPFIIAGKNIKSDYLIQNAVYQYDQAATVAYLLGIEPPQAWIGRPVTEAVVGFPDREVEEGGGRMIAKPDIQPAGANYAVDGGLFVDSGATAEISSAVAGAEIRYTLDGSDPTRESQTYSGPFSIDTTAVLKARVYTSDGESPVSTAYFRIARSGSDRQWRWKYYNIPAGAQAMPLLAGLRPVREGTSHEARLTEIETGESDFAMVFEANFIAPRDGMYTFYSNSDDGSNVWVKGEKVVDNDGNHGTIERGGRIELQAGSHPIRVEYFQGYGGQWLDVYVRGPGIPKQILPSDLIRRL